MAVINELIAQVEDRVLRERIETEFKKINNTKKFGIVFEDHLPECVPLYGLPIKKGITVALKDRCIKDFFVVVKNVNGVVTCVDKQTKEVVELSEDSLVPVSLFGEPIYPQLIPMDKVENDPDSNLWHTLIESDNFHALQLLEYLYPKQIDCIYIDPPYNTGAKDWKYNNNYVDSNDSFRHSKWMSMMQKRLKIAKHLLKDSGILVATIDDYELAHLDCLFQELFSDYDRFIVTIEHSRRGRRGKNMAKSNEYALFLVKHGYEVICQEPAEGIGGEVRNLRRTGSSSLRTQRPKKFYPIYIDTDNKSVVEIGDSIPTEEPVFYTVPEAIKERYPNCHLSVVWPIDEDGIQKNWHYAAPRAKAEFLAGKLSVREQSYGWQVYYQLRERSSKKYKTVWTGSHLDASTHGTELLATILGRGQAFDFPKSLYAVKQCLSACVLDKKDSLILDFFAGSGTTLHAINLLNAEDGGQRRCILVTNNEVSDAEAKEMKNNGLCPGQPEWEEHGICQSVTWPRTKYSILGRREDGSELAGEYMSSLMVEKEVNRKFIQIGFISSADLDSVAKKKQLISLFGKEKLPQSLVKANSDFIVSNKHATSILFNDSCLDQWLDALEDQDHIEEFYIVTLNKTTFSNAKKQITELLGKFNRTESAKIPMSTGFKSNVEYFKLGFLDKSSVELGLSFNAILPMLWLQSGSVGKRPTIVGETLPEILIANEGTFAVLLEESSFSEFKQILSEHKAIQYAYLVTDSQVAFRTMAAQLDTPNVKQLYRDYIDNFTINTRRNLI